MTKPSFTQFGPTFQEKIVQALLVDKTWAQQVSEIIDTDYFDLEYLKYLSTQYFSYFLKYKNFPTFQLLITIVRDDFKNNKSDDTALRDHSP
jgi:DNA-dependent RNA polymerase auxiliary subunit epsilon